MHEEHQCLVFEKLSCSLYDLLRKTNFMGLKLPLIQLFVRQLLQTLQFLSHPRVQVIHCDLKPENILLAKKDSMKLKVIDFGSACKSHERVGILC